MTPLDIPGLLQVLEEYGRHECDCGLKHRIARRYGQMAVELLDELERRKRDAERRAYIRDFCEPVGPVSSIGWTMYRPKDAS